MAQFVFLQKFTHQGVTSIKDGPSKVTDDDGATRLDLGSHRTSHRIFREFGAELHTFVMTMGRFDVVMVADVPDDETAAKIALTLSSGGMVVTETMRAFTEAEFRQIVAALP